MFSSTMESAARTAPQGRLNRRCVLADLVGRNSIDIDALDVGGNIPGATPVPYGQWQIFMSDPSCTLHASDGKSVHAIRGGDGTSSRFVVVGAVSGFLDITDLGTVLALGGWPGKGFVKDEIGEFGMDEIDQFDMKQHDEDGNIICRKPKPHFVHALDINGHRFTVRNYDTVALLSLTVDKGYPNCLKITGFTNDVSCADDVACTLFCTTTVIAPLVPFPEIFPDDILLLQAMMLLKLVPYQNIPDAPGKTEEELQKLGEQFFGPFTASSFELAMSVYDWTTASFFRLVLLKHFVYSAMSAEAYPLDMPTIAQMIWESNWKTYNPQDADFMHSLFMEPATSLEDLQSQLKAVAATLRVLVDAQSRLISAGLIALPRSSIKLVPKLYSGQVDIYQYTTSRFLPLFLEFPGNEGPSSTPLQMPLVEGMDSQLKAGNILTSKAGVSFTTTKEDALHYANGILLILSPPNGAHTWPKGAYVTPLSDNPYKIEYLMPPLTRYRIIKTSVDLELVVISLMLVVD